MNFKSIKRMTIIIIVFFLMNASCFAKFNANIFNFNYQHKSKLENFVLLMSVIDFKIETVPESTASGFVFKTYDDSIMVLTANHFCNPSHYGLEDEFISMMEGERKITIFNNDIQRNATIEYYDKQNDICVLKAEKKKEDNFFKVKFANKMPNIGDKIYNVSAPHGIASPNVILLFDGYFGGCNITFNGCIFTIPASSGSSGSAVYNKKGELISIIVSSLVSFDNISMGPHVSMMKGISDYENFYR
jgi:S1-C subfamily serine protease